MYLVLCAMEDEAAEIINRVKITEKFLFFNKTYYKGFLGKHEIITGVTGIGKVLSAITTQKLIDCFLPEKILFLGIAGGLKDNIDIGDIVISSDCMQHDMDASSIGFKKGEIPYTGIRTIEADKTMADAAKTFIPEKGKIITGRILTGDQFITTKSKKDFLITEFDGSAVEMEGAAAALTAKMNNIPFLIVRIISDKSDGNAPDDFKKFLKESSKKLADIAVHIIER